jgi:hypothetical protein
MALIRLVVRMLVVRMLVVRMLLARAAVAVIGAAVHLLRERRTGRKTHARAQ